MIQLLAALCIAASGDLEVVPGHKATSVTAGANIRLEDGVLSLRVESPGELRLVLRSKSPAWIRSATGATCTLAPGWDGTLGYSLYALQIRASTPGTVGVHLETIPAPSSPVVTTSTETSQYCSRLDERAPRFPDDPDGFSRWKAEYRVRLAKALMGDGVPGRVPLNAEILETRERSGFSLRRIRYQCALIVDDEESIALLIAEYLESVGYEVAVCTSGIHALDRIDSGSFDLIVSDVQLPDVDGLTIPGEVERRRPELPNRFVLATGDVTDLEVRQFAESHGLRTILKPFTKKEVLDAVFETISTC